MGWVKMLGTKMIASSRRLTGALIILAALIATGAVQAVEVQRVISPGGIEAWLVEDHSNPLISIDIMMNGGAALDPEDKQGVARLTATTIDEGAGDLDSQAFRQEIDRLNISLSFSTASDSFTASLSTLTQNRERAFELMRLARLEPRLDEEPVERIRRQLIAADLQEAENPRAQVSEAFEALIFGDHPYGMDADGTAEGLKRITNEDIRTYLGMILAKDNLSIGVSGDITPEDLGRLLDETFGSLPQSTERPEIPDFQVEAPGGLLLIEREIPQSIVRFGHEGIARDDPDYYVARVINHILGGGSFSSRLMEEIREKRGLAYGVSSHLINFDHSELIMGSVQTQNARLAETLELLYSEWARMAEEGPSEEELEAAQKYLTGNFPLRLTSSGAISGLLAAVMRQDLGIDYIDRYADYINAVTLEDVRRVAAELLKPEALTIVVVGQPEGVVATLENPKEAADGAGG